MARRKFQGKKRKGESKLTAAQISARRRNMAIARAAKKAQKKKGTGPSARKKGKGGFVSAMRAAKGRKVKGWG